jgi:endonuclease III
MVPPKQSPPHAQRLLLEVDRRLRKYGLPRHGNLDDPLEELVFILLSDQTEEYSYTRTYAALREEFPTWEALSEAEPASVANVIQLGGLQNKKARYLQASLEKIRTDFGELSLNALRNFTDEGALRYLESLPGVSAKNARCILMYSFSREVFPVDTHVWRVCRRLGLTPAVPKPSTKDQRDLEALVFPPIRYSLHVDLVAHGREVCLTYWPKCESCLLEDLCPSKDKPDDVWGRWRRPRGAWAKYSVRKDG